MEFNWESNLVKSFPYDTFGSKTYLSDCDWGLADEEHVHFESDFDYADFTADDLLNDGFVKKVQRENEVYYAKRLGDIWIGRSKNL